MSGRAAPRLPAIRVFDRQRRLAVAPRALARVAREALASGGWDGGAVEIALVDDRTLARLHARFLDDPRRTDVMAFDYRTGGGPGPIGAELVVSAERARAEARRRGHPPEEELALYVAHGCLHLCGFRDGSTREARAMRRAEARALSRAGVPCRFALRSPL